MSNNEMIQTAMNLGVESFVPAIEEVTEMKVNEVLSTGPAVKPETEIVTEEREYGTNSFSGKIVHTLGDESILTDRPFVAVALSRFSSAHALAMSERAAHSLAAEGSHNLLVCGLLEEDMPMIRKHIEGGGCVLVVCSLGLDGIEITPEVQTYINRGVICIISQFHDHKEWVLINGQARNTLIAKAELVTSLFIAECRSRQHAWDLAGRCIANGKKVYIPALAQSSRKELAWMKKNGATELQAEAQELGEVEVDVYAQLLG